MRLTSRKLRQMIKEELAHVIFDDIHEVPDDLEHLNPYEAYGLGHEAGMEHASPEDRPYDPPPESPAEGDPSNVSRDITPEQIPESWLRILGDCLNETDNTAA